MKLQDGIMTMRHIEDGVQVLTGVMTLTPGGEHLIKA